MRTYYKPKAKGPLSGGIRVGAKGSAFYAGYTTGEYVTLVPGRLIWGLHNTPQWIHKVGEGYHFNVIGLPDDWHDFIPDYAVPKGRNYVERVGECRAASRLSAINQREGVFELKIWDEDGKVGYVDLCAPPIAKRER